MQNTDVNSKAKAPPLTDLIYAILGLTFLRHRTQGLSQLPRDQVYAVLKTLANRHSDYFPRVYFTQRGSLAHSKQVEDVLFRLGGVVSVQNPRYQYLSFRQNELVHVETKLKKWFTPQDKDIVENLAEEFYSELIKDNQESKKENA